MLNEVISNCIIFTFKDEDFESFNGIYKHNAVSVIKGTVLPKDTEKPIIIIGWENVRKLFPNQSFIERKIAKDLYWCFSLLENREKALIDSKNLIDEINEGFLSLECITYDFMLDGDFNNFINTFINKEKSVYVYFYTTACYIYNNGNTLCINLESLKVNEIDIKRVLTDLFNDLEVCFFSYDNLSPYIFYEEIKPTITFENIFWTKYATELIESDFKRLFPDVSDIKRFLPALMSKVSQIEMSEDEKKSTLKYFRKDIITGWLSKQETYFDKNFKSEKIDLIQQNDLRYKRLKFSNKRTITGRINCVDKQFNPQVLDKNSDYRKHIISRYKNGKIVIMDYVSFETKISLFLSNDKDFIEKYKDTDLHIETSKVIFCKDIISKEERKIGKHINHTLLYGGGNEKLKSILKDIPNNVEVLNKVKSFLNPIINKIEEINEFYDKQGYIVNVFKTIVRPNKAWAGYNNYMSSTATDIVIEKLFEIREFIKNKKIHLMFQIHDSFVFDVHPEEMKHIEEFINYVSHFKNSEFQIDYKVGNNLFECNA